MKWILIVTACFSTTCARFVPLGEIYDPGYQYKRSESYNSHEKDRAADESYFANTGIVRVNAPSSSLYPVGYPNIFDLRRSYNVPRPNYFTTSWSSSPGVESYDVNKYYDSKKTSSESDQSFYNSGRVNWPLTNGENINWLRSGNNLISPNAARGGVSIWSPNSNVPLIRPSINAASPYEVNQAYVSKQSANEADQSYFDSTVANSGNNLPGVNNYVQSTDLPSINYLPIKYSPLNSPSAGSVPGLSLWSSADNQISDAAPNAKSVNWLSPGLRPLALSNGYYPTYSQVQGYNSKLAERESDQNYASSASINNGNGNWLAGRNYISGLPSTYDFPPGVPYSPSALLSKASETRQTAGGNSNWLGGNTDHSSVSPVSTGDKGNNAYDVSQSSTLGRNDNQGTSPRWISLPKISQSYVPVYNVPLSSQRVVSESLKDLASQSGTDKSSYLSNVVNSNQGSLRESAGSRSSSNNQRSHFSYDFSDVVNNAPPPAPWYNRSVNNVPPPAPWYSRSVNNAPPPAPWYSRSVSNAPPPAPWYSRSVINAPPPAPWYSRSVDNAPRPGTVDPNRR